MKECTQGGKKRKYNYIIIGISSDFTKACYADLSNEAGVYVPEHASGCSGRIQRALFKLHWSVKLNALVKLPLKKLWFKQMCVHDFNNNKPICFVFLGGQYIAGNTELQKYIYSLNPDNRIVIKYGDLIAKKHYKDFEIIRNSADLLVTYDPIEAKQYGISCFKDRIYSRLLKVTEKDKFETDVYFIGYAKDRLDTIFNVYHYLTGHGLKCRFDLVGVPREKRKVLPGIEYSKGISYIESLKRVCSSKCVLEICQGGSRANTLRHAESIVYHRLLLTNSDVKNSDYYIPETMIQFDMVDQIDIEAIKRPIDYMAFKKANIHFSPTALLDFLEDRL